MFLKNNNKISAVPACAYIVQNNLLIFALTILDAATYQAWSELNIYLICFNKKKNIKSLTASYRMVHFVVEPDILWT